MRLHPVRARDDVLHQQGDRKHQPRHKPAAGLVMAAHKDIGRHQRRKRQQQSHQHGWHHQVAHGCIAGIARVEQVGLQIARHITLLLRDVHGLACRTEAAQQRIDDDGHNAQHHDFAKGVEAAEVHQHHIDHIGAATAAQRVFEEEGGGAFIERPAHHGKCQPGHATTGNQRQHQIAQAACLGPGIGVIGRAHILVPLGQPAQPQQDQHRGGDFHHQLSQSQIGGREPEEGQHRAQARAAEHDQCGHPVVLGFPGRAQRTQAANCPEQDKSRRHGQSAAIAQLHAP